MERKHNPVLTKNAKELRKNMTKEERHLWYDFLKGYPLHFLRQKVIDDYIVDFYCHDARLIIELDGSQHYENAGQKADEARDSYLNSLGITVLRYSNADINLRFSAVCEDIWNKLKLSEKKPSP